MQVIVRSPQDYEKTTLTLRHRPDVTSIIFGRMSPHPCDHIPVRSGCPCFNCKNGYKYEMDASSLVLPARYAFLTEGIYFYPEFVFPKRLVGIKEFQASGLDGLDLAFLGKKIETLFLDRCRLINAPVLEMFRSLKRLEIFNNIALLPEIDFSGMKSLETLYFETDKKVNLRECTNLTSVRLCSARLAVADCMPHENLRSLELYNCSSEDDATIDLRACTKLAYILLRNTRLRRLVTGRIEEIPGMRNCLRIDLKKQDYVELTLGGETVLSVEDSIMPTVLSSGGTLYRLHVEKCKMGNNIVDEAAVSEPRVLELADHYGLVGITIEGLTGCREICGLEFCYQLNHIILSNCPDLEHLPPVENLCALEYLEVSQNLEAHLVSSSRLNLLPLVSSTLKRVVIDGIHLESLDFLSDLQLTSVFITNARLTSLEGLRCEDLVLVNLLGNQLTCIEPLRKASSLKQLNIIGNPVTVPDWIDRSQVEVKC